ncbi:MAG: hypothetical protein HY225_00045 [Candidatus Vogelbacteria bacterium]|nr:hypothetical protein [Candidatus Vogelbacteria bacterium]
MNLCWIKSVSKQTAIFTLTVLLVVGLFGVLGGMKTDMNGKMGNCPFTLGASVCTMSLFEHLEAWQGLFSSIPKTFGANTLWAGLLTVFFVTLYSVLQNTKNDVLFTKERRRLRSHVLFSNTTLQEAFSQGILNTKAY